MRKVGFDPAEGVALLGELAQLTLQPGGGEEVCEQACALIGRALGSPGGCVLVREAPDNPVETQCRWGEGCEEEVGPRAAAYLQAREILEEKTSKSAHPSRIVLPLLADAGYSASLVLRTPTVWDGSARRFAASAARTLGASLRAARLLGESRRQGELLARRNVELDVLRELAWRLQEPRAEQEILQASLELVLEKMGLEAGWILWGRSGDGQLELAACRGISEEFERSARDKGIGSCLCHDVFATGTFRYARNTSECPRLPELITGFRTKSHACVPLKFERGVLGVMNIASRPGRSFTPQELQFLETVGGQVCLAVDKARTSRAESRRNAEAQALATLAKAIGGSLDEGKVLSAVGDYTRELLSADRCAIFLGDDPADLLFAHLSGPPMEGLRVGERADVQALGSRALVESLERRHALVIHDALRDPRASNQLARKWGVGSAITVPLAAYDRLGGLLQVSRSAASEWSQEEVDLTEALAGQASVAIESARLYRDAEEALVKLQKAQYGMMRAERMAAVGTLASSLAHEVRNPLNSIHLQLVLLSRRLGKLGEPERAELAGFLDTARKEITRLDGLVEEFLSLSTVDRVVLSDVPPEDVLREVLSLMHPVAREAKVSLTEQFTLPLPPVPMDREKIKQVLINLIRNSIEAMPEGGRLTLAARAANGLCTIDVVDTGTGIEPGLDVWDFFVTTKHGGTGLGLPIARRIVEAHGGSLGYDSEPGRGTTFTVSLKTR
jgi:signal transduction histidine kinase